MVAGSEATQVTVAMTLVAAVRHEGRAVLCASANVNERVLLLAAGTSREADVQQGLCILATRERTVVDGGVRDVLVEGTPRCDITGVTKGDTVTRRVGAHHRDAAAGAVRMRAVASRLRVKR